MTAEFCSGDACIAQNDCVAVAEILIDFVDQILTTDINEPGERNATLSTCTLSLRRARQIHAQQKLFLRFRQCEHQRRHAFLIQFAESFVFLCSGNLHAGQTLLNELAHGAPDFADELKIERLLEVLAFAPVRVEHLFARFQDVAEAFIRHC